MFSAFTENFASHLGLPAQRVEELRDCFIKDFGMLREQIGKLHSVLLASGAELSNEMDVAQAFASSVNVISEALAQHRRSLTSEMQLMNPQTKLNANEQKVLEAQVWKQQVQLDLNRYSDM